MTAVKINDDCNCYCRFRSSNRDDENGKENSIELIRVQIFVEGNEVDIYGIQNKLNSNQHGDHVPARDETVDADEEESGAEE